MTSPRLIDLHCHSTCSDGTFTPRQLAARAHRNGLSAVALTDHDNYAGYTEFREACTHHGIEAVTGVEISATWDDAPGRPRGVDILGYGFDPTDPTLRSKLDFVRRARVDRNGLIVERLNELGIPITVEMIRAEAGSEVVGRPHIARALVRMKVVADMSMAFDRYLADGAAAHVPKARLTLEETIGLIRAAGGFTSLAHPFVNPLKTEADFRAFLEPLVAAGLGGIEVMYSDHTAHQEDMLRGLARELGLVATGGSDFHGDNRPQVDLGRGFGALRVPYRVLEEIREALARNPTHQPQWA